MGHLQPLPKACALALSRRVARQDEVDDLTALLLSHTPSPVPTRVRQIAEGIAVGCLGDNHLWQDLQLPSRVELSALFRDYFGALAQKNVHDMKWKKFLYKQLCEREEIFICKSPSCAICVDHSLCFGPET